MRKSQAGKDSFDEGGQTDLKSLPKKEVIRMESETIRIENLTNQMKGIRRLHFCHKMLRLQGWYHSWGLPAGEQMRKHWSKMAELLGNKPSYFVTYSYRNALWGLNWKGLSFLLYKSQRGITLQVPKDFPFSKVIPLVSMLIHKLRARGK